MSPRLLCAKRLARCRRPPSSATEYHLRFPASHSSVVCLRAAMDHSVKAMHSHRKVVFSRLLNRHNFENRELEQLYRRYTVKLQQTSTSSVLVLTALLVVSLAGLHVAYARFLTAAAIFYIMVLILFGGSLILMQTGHVKDAHLPALCYGVLALSSGLCIVGLPVHVSDSNTWGAGSWGQRHAAVHGAWEVLFVLFIAYSLLPLQTRIAVCVGVLLPALHTAVALSSANTYQEIAWQQVSSCLHLVISNTHFKDDLEKEKSLSSNVHKNTYAVFKIYILF